MNIVIATCRKRPELTPSDDLLRLELEARGAKVSATPWDLISSDDSGRSLVCLRSTWDYHLRSAEFRRWVEAFRPPRSTLWNPAETVLWNLDKTYLRELAAAGIAIPHTRWFDPGQRPDIDAFLGESGISRAVLKPRVSATAHGTHLVGRGTGISDADWGPLETSGSLLQSFVPEIESRGEASLVFLAGGLSHSVRKLPATGDFRVQSDFGGRFERVAASPALRAFGEAVLTAVARPWLYARVDAIETETGPVLMELELIEPDLFLELAPAGAGILAEALIAEAAESVPGRPSVIPE